MTSREKTTLLHKQNKKDLKEFLLDMVRLSLDPKSAQIDGEEAINPCSTLIKRLIERDRGLEWFVSHMQAGSGPSTWRLGPDITLSWEVTETVVHAVCVYAKQRDVDGSGKIDPQFSHFVNEANRLSITHNVHDWPTLRSDNGDDDDDDEDEK